MKIDMVFDYEMGTDLASTIQELLNESFQKDFPKNRIYFKQLPHFRFVAFNEKNQLIGQVGIDYRVMNLNGEPIRVLGLIDLCVTQNTRSKGIGSKLLLEIEQFCCNRNIDFLLLFADNKTLYLKNGYRSVTNKCKWLKINHESQITRGIGYEKIEGLMIKEVGKYGWREGDLDFLGYLY
ncbi:GNAT family N-acetyltransferase [Peribacillus psychrosaccharolyticus]|uniref:GNAT family N-acetyltransferase n=1 Tax=Peribacillus psychrosaccharolyticus TaxID=1407 RepID=UPI00030F2C5A|nr:GNAT family N-acetyltransferase [Peribacillus psychrosaccharolyticus]